ncbi:MAG: hypothetical protein MUF10_10285 [Thermoanaerobaculaceae bacterium]|jgi:hypothetical protein|nr:hypothetical protein [Thermoanaerobaculaceae bacterium]
MARLFVVDERIYNVLPRNVVSRISSPDICVETGPRQRLTDLLAEVRRRLTLGPAPTPGPPVPRPRHGRATTLPAVRPAAGLQAVSHLFLAAHGSSGHLQLSADGLGTGNIAALAAIRGVVTVGVEIHACAVASCVPIRLQRRHDGIADVSSWVATAGDLEPFWMPQGGTPTLRQCLAGRYFDPRTAQVVREGQGVRFLLAFANAIGAQVTGAVQAQSPDSAWQFEKTTVIAFPGGRLVLRVTADDTTFGPDTAGTFEVP